MKRWTLVMVAIVALGGCSDSGSDDAGDDVEETTSTPDARLPAADDLPPAEDSDGPGEISVTSTAFEFEGTIADKYGLDGDNVSPPLEWIVDVEGAAELVVVMDDPDAPGEEPFTHWMIAGLSPDSTGLDEGEVPDGAVEGTTDFGEAGYGGPAPPPGERHRYSIKLIALDAPSGLEEGFTVADLEAVVDAHFLLSAETAGFFGEAS